MKNQLQSHIFNSLKLKELYKPLYYRLKIPSEKQKLQEIITSNSGIQVYDEIVSQVEELIKSRNPKTFYNKETLHREAIEFLNQHNHEEYGVWVYYPWNNKLIHLLDEKEFIEVRTNRNHYKISFEEKEILINKKIGIIGLSVGHSIAMTIATERICSELRIADFDVLELSNLNRIRTPVYNLGCSKVVIVAREIAEIDPYLKVIPYDNGLNEENIDEFFLNNGKLDLCVEVCDGLDIKVLTRQKAKELGVPVVMNTSDRGSTDIERFDLTPNLSLLHGLADHLDLSKVKEARTNEEKIPYVISMIGLDTTSPRLKASMLEIAESINTWPQLASAVVLGGGIITDVSRRILLSQFNDSGRYFIDLEEIFKDKEYSDTNNYSQNIIGSLSDKDLIDIIASHPFKNRTNKTIHPSVEVIEKIVTAGIQAPLAMNNQPWKFVYKDGLLYLFHVHFNDYPSNGSRLTLSDVAIGSVIENMALAARELKLEIDMELSPNKSNKRLIAIFEFFQNDNINIEEPLHDLTRFIDTIVSPKNLKLGEKLDQKIVEEFEAITSTISGAGIEFVQTSKGKEEIAEVIGIAERVRILYPEIYNRFFDSDGVQDIFQLLKTNNSLDSDDLNLSPSEYLSMKICSDTKVISLLKKWNKGGGIEKLSRVSVEASSKIGLITIPNFNFENLINGGRVIQRLQLLARKHNLLLKPYFSPIILSATNNEFGLLKFNLEVQEELKFLREKFLSTIPIDNKNVGLFLFTLNISKISANKRLPRPFNKDLFLNYH